MKHIFTKKNLYLGTLLLTLPIMIGCNNEDDEPISGPVGDLSTRRINFLSVEYNPAPGQFINDMPVYEEGDTRQTMNQKALEALNNGSLISLGALGGEIVMYLSEPIYADNSRKYDFRVLGNSYITGEESGVVYGSAEPGMVWVMKDSNGNGLPDDTWYCFLGEMKDEIKLVNITYTPVSDPTSSEWVAWQTTEGESGFLTCNLSFHNHTYFPKWLFDDMSCAQMTLSAYCVPANGLRDSETGLYKQICYPGFADCFPNSDKRSAFSLRDAVSLDGTPANIDRVDFVRVTTAVIDSNGPLGEASTEVGGIEVFY